MSADITQIRIWTKLIFNSTQSVSKLFSFTLFMNPIEASCTKEEIIWRGCWVGVFGLSLKASRTKEEMIWTNDWRGCWVGVFDLSLFIVRLQLAELRSRQNNKNHTHDCALNRKECSSWEDNFVGGFPCGAAREKKRKWSMTYFIESRYYSYCHHYYLWLINYYVTALQKKKHRAIELCSAVHGTTFDYWTPAGPWSWLKRETRIISPLTTSSFEKYQSKRPNMSIFWLKKMWMSFFFLCSHFLAAQSKRRRGPAQRADHQQTCGRKCRCPLNRDHSNGEECLLSGKILPKKASFHVTWKSCFFFFFSLQFMQFGQFIVSRGITEALGIYPDEILTMQSRQWMRLKNIHNWFRKR